MNEQWRDIPDSPEWQVSDMGNVRRHLDGNWEPVKVGSAGSYHYVSINGKQMLVHHLVLESFVGPRQEGMVARHFHSPLPSDNRLFNLRWGTDSDNAQDRIRHESEGHPAMTLPRTLMNVPKPWADLARKLSATRQQPMLWMILALIADEAERQEMEHPPLPWEEE